MKKVPRYNPIINFAKQFMKQKKNSGKYVKSVCGWPNIPAQQTVQLM